MVPLRTLTAGDGARAHGARAKAGTQYFFLSFYLSQGPHSGSDLTNPDGSMQCSLHLPERHRRCQACSRWLLAQLACMAQPLPNHASPTAGPHLPSRWQAPGSTQQPQGCRCAVAGRSTAPSLPQGTHQTRIPWHGHAPMHTAASHMPRMLPTHTSCPPSLPTHPRT